jgi:hypothetical protein
MKKKAAVMVFMLALVSTAALAETTKEVAGKVGDFWAREGERSGLKESTANWGNFWKNINPKKFFADQKAAYDARKGGASDANSSMTGVK